MRLKIQILSFFTEIFQFNVDCLKPESNRRPARYECAALPTELFRQRDILRLGIIFDQYTFFETGRFNIRFFSKLLKGDKATLLLYPSASKFDRKSLMIKGLAFLIFFLRVKEDFSVREFFIIKQFNCF